MSTGDLGVGSLSLPECINLICFQLSISLLQMHCVVTIKHHLKTKLNKIDRFIELLMQSDICIYHVSYHNHAINALVN